MKLKGPSCEGQAPNPVGEAQEKDVIESPPCSGHSSQFSTNKAQPLLLESSSELCSQAQSMWLIEWQENAFKSSSPGYTPRDSNQVSLGRDLGLKLRGNVHPVGF